MIKILFVSNTANFSKFNRPYMCWIHKQGWQVDYASPCEEEVLDCDNSYKIDIARSPFSFKNIKAISELKKLIKENNYSIIHCHTPMGAIVARFAAKKFRKQGLKIIYTAHGFHFYKGAPLKDWFCYYPIEKYFSKYTDVLVTINEEDYRIAQKKFYTKSIKKIDGVGVNLEKFTPVTGAQKTELRKKYGYTDKDFILLYIAEFIPRKNHQILFNILPELYKQIPELKVMFCGKGELLDFFMKKARELNIQRVVNFAGYRNDIDKVSNIADLYITTSRQEGLPVSVIEAMASGLPIIASRIRGHVDIIQDGRNGLLFDLNNKKQLFEAIIRLYTNSDERKKYAETNIQDVKKYSVNIAVQKMAEIYKTIM